MNRSWLVLMCLFSITSYADCKFEKLKLEKRSEESSFAKLNEHTQLILEGADNEHRIHEGPAWLEVNGRKKCTIEGGIFSGVFFELKKNLLMTVEYSGSCGEHRIIDTKTCEQKGRAASYCGSAYLEGDNLINDPPCESLSNDGKLGSCSTGKVFRISKETCELKLDKAASLKLTKEKLGIELPMTNKAYRVSGIGTKEAKIEKE